MELWIKRYGLWKHAVVKQFFQEVLSQFRNFRGCWSFLAQKIGALAKFGNFLGTFVGFWSVWSGSGRICNYFPEAMGPAVNIPNAQDCGAIYNKLKDLFAKW
jgi:hypothetical protein